MNRLLNVKFLIIVPIVGTFFIVLAGITQWVIKPSILEKIVEIDYIGYNTNGSLNQMTKSWETPSYDMKLEIYIFDVKNPKDVVNGSRPRLVQKGPYTFVEKQSKKFNISSDRERVVYRNNHLYYFAQNLSCPTCFLSDRVTVPNLLLQKLLDFADSERFVKIILETAAKIANETVFITVSVGELLFDGYKDPLVSGICDRPLISGFCRAFNIPGRIGIFYGQNNTDDGSYEINTGISQRSWIGKVYSWDNQTQLPDTVWYAPKARQIRGTDGQLFKPFLERGEHLELFVSQVCRVVDMQWNFETSFKGISVFEYGPADSMNNITLQKELGFCNPKAPRYFDNYLVQPLNCTPAGVMDVSSCIPGNVRIYISQPFFYNCPAALHNAVDGLRRPVDDDRTFVQIHPEAGVVLHAVRKSQINVGLSKGTFNFLSKMNNVIVPMLWLNETITADPETEAMIAQLSTILKVLPTVMIVCVAVGGFLFIGGIVSMVLSVYFKETDVPLLAEDDELDEQGNEENDVSHSTINDE